MENSANILVNYGDMAKEIRTFLEKKRKPDELIQGHVTEVDAFENAITIHLDKNFDFSEGNFVPINHKQGSVVYSHKSMVKIEFKEDISEFKGINVEIDTSLTNTLVNRLEKTIYKIEKNDLDKNNIKVLDFIMGKRTPHYQDENVTLINDDLNSSQQEAVSSAVNAEDFHLVIGPPGTGKTLIIAEIIQQLVLKKCKILLTAYTNSAVDNILEKFVDLDIQILRIGSDISPLNLKYSMNERRKNHKEWAEIERINKLIKLAKEEIKPLLKEENLIQRIIIPKINNKRKDLENDLKDILRIRDKCLKKVDSDKSSFDQEDNEFLEIEKEKGILENNANKYYSVSKHILELHEAEPSPSDRALLHKLKSEIKKMNYQKFLRKLISIFDKRSYHKFLGKLNDKETVHKKIEEACLHYQKLYGHAKRECDKIYPEEVGYPDQDSLDLEIRLLKQLNEYISLKNKNTLQNLELNKTSIISESYKKYLDFLDQKSNALEAEIEELKTESFLKDKYRSKIINKIKNIEESIHKYKKDKKSLIDYIDSRIIEEADIIATSVDSSTKSIIDSILFDYVIMDESSQVAVYKSFMPLLQCKKFILIGDDNQLKPIKEPELLKELNQSIFNRLIEKYGNFASFLDTQYRMNKQIADIASSLFYGGKLKTFEGIADQCLECKINSDMVNPIMPLTFIDTADFDYYEDEFDKGCENTKEAQLVAQIVSEFLENGIQSEDIGVITPYTKHKKNIRRQITDKEVKVDTVYGFQGKEKDIIIMSFCKSKPYKLRPGSTRFIENPTQVNVAITRAKKKFIMIGNSKTLKQSELLGNVIEMMEKE